MLHFLRRIPLLCSFRWLVILLILSSCVSWKNNSNQGISSTPTADTHSDAIPLILHPIDTWNNIHIFQTFDYNISDPTLFAKYYDFVWGAEVNHLNAWRSSNANILLSYYIPFNREQTFFGKDPHHDLSYWKVTHPDWVLYKCDRVTPAYEFGDPTMPLDFSNPTVISWQIRTYLQPASEKGYNGVAADNVELQNIFGACGVYKNGRWVQHYSGRSDDPRWRTDVIHWLKQIQSALHQLKHPLALIPNISLLTAASISDQVLQQVMSYSDGIVDENGFTHSGTTELTDKNWLQEVQLIENVQKQQKPYYIIDQITPMGTQEILWDIASYLMAKEHSAALFISPIQEYGTSLLYKEYNVQIGSPMVPMYEAQHIYLRDYSLGLSLVNPSSTEAYTVTLKEGNRYSDLNGNPIAQTITLPPHSGMVLLKRSQ